MTQHTHSFVCPVPENVISIIKIKEKSHNEYIMDSKIYTCNFFTLTVTVTGSTKFTMFPSMLALELNELKTHVAAGVAVK